MVSPSHRRCCLRRLRVSTRIAPRGPTPKQSCVASHSDWGRVRRNDAEPEGTLTARLNETAPLLGVTVGGVKVQEAPLGRELCWHESVIASCGLPVLALSAREKVAVPPGETVCEAG